MVITRPLLKGHIRHIVITSLATLAPTTLAQSDPDQSDSNEAQSVGEIRYVTDVIRTPVRSGAGADYRILNRGLPSGTAVTFFATSDDGVWAEVETAGGTRGWLRAQYLQTDIPVANRFSEVEAALAAATARAEAAESQLADAEASSATADKANKAISDELQATKDKLNNIKRISANAIELDRMNQILSGELEEIRAKADMLKLDNARLEERASSNRFLQGIFAVIVGIVIALVVPRFTGKRRRFDTWR